MVKIKSQSAKHFIICLIAALFLWISFSSSDVYQYNLSYLLHVKLVDKKSLSSSEAVIPISIQFESSGWEAFFRKSKHSKSHLSLYIEDDFRNIKSGIAAIYLQNYKDQIMSQFRLFTSKNITILTDTLYIPLQNTISKKVKVQAKNIQYQFASRCGISINNTPFLFPDSVMIQGDSLTVSKINFVETEACELRGLSETEVFYLSLKKELLPTSVQLKPSFVAYYVPVDEFTEQIIKVPVRVADMEEKDLKIYPEKVDVVVLVALDDYEKVTSDQFIVEADYPDTSGGRMKVKLSQFPSFVRIQKIVPEEVDYVIIK